MNGDGHVQISDYSDREILAIMLDLGGEVSAQDLATRVYGWPVESGWEDKDVQAHGKRCTTQRLSWMRRFGLVEGAAMPEGGKGPGLWTVSEDARRMVTAKLPQTVEKILARDLDVASLELANRIGEKLYRAGDITGTAMRRELQFQIARRKRSGR